MLSSYWNKDDGFVFKERTGIERYFIRHLGTLHWGNSKEELKERFNQIEDIDKKIKSFSFISSKVQDNYTLMRNDPDYISNLEALPEAEKQRFLHGNWLYKEQGEWFKEIKFKDWDNKEECDPAYSGNDYTALTLGYKDKEDQYVIRGWVWRKSIVELEDTIIQIANSFKCGSLSIETNGDQEIMFEQMAKSYPTMKKDRAVGNKHNRIISNVYKDWNKIYFDRNTVLLI